MTPALTEACNFCGGSGTVPRALRRLPNGELDQFDTIFWPEVVCEACGGGGRMPLRVELIEEQAPAG